ncbi:DUF4124 domain-containing protein [Psychrobacter sanguinis]|uniref:DUF4124 domain-containing protein n=1 Tax=Psychrobacter sanguinis TaxID=861445 RepID=A0A844M0D3_9GAMM|nr:DUF4124 domain-containing protein [Psychrobacter sanguinis]MUG32386.1 DUF4124 domain-containing protein [Psychrobacter sanguinis]
MRGLVVCGLLALSSASAMAGDMYVYKDTKGNVLVSNKGNPTGAFNKYAKKVKIDYHPTINNNSNNTADITSNQSLSSNLSPSDSLEVTKNMYLYQDDQGHEHLSSIKPSNSSKSFEKVKVSYTRLNPPSTRRNNRFSIFTDLNRDTKSRLENIERLSNSAEQKADELADLARPFLAQ